MIVPALLAAETLPVRAPNQFAREIIESSDHPAALRIHTGAVDGLATVYADVAVDEEFISRHGTDWRDALDLAIGSANDLLKAVGVRVKVASVSNWESNDDQAHMSGLLDGVLASTQRGTGRLLLAVTSQGSIKFDGMAREAQAAVAVRYKNDDWRHNGSLIAHEIAHLLGANHHPADEVCESGGCIMEPAGYAHASEWCDHHREAIGAYLAEAAA